MKLVLARHGNNFDAGQKVTWVGGREDLPLVPSGIAQAQEVGQSLKKTGFQPSRFFCSELMRTKDYASTMIKEMGLNAAVVVREELNEIDYGSWGGLSTEEIIAQDPRAKEALELWEKQSRWPDVSPWGPGEAVLTQQAANLAEELKNGADTVIVSSNGVLRYFLKLAKGEFERRVAGVGFKMKTGYCGVLEYDGAWRVLGWNLSPAELEATLAKATC